MTTVNLDWVNLRKYGPPDEEGNYLCVFGDNTIETCTYTGPDDIFWNGKQTGPYAIIAWCEMQDSWLPDALREDEDE